jgi:hypothetical protein
MYFLFAQICFALWAAMFAHFQTPCIKAMKDYVPLNNPYHKPFHARSFTLSTIVAVFLIGLVFGCTRQWQTLFLIPIFIAIYKVLFDGVIGKEVYDDFYFIGTTAKQDRWINTHFPHDKPGEVKVFICSIAFLFFNVTNFLM